MTAQVIRDTHTIIRADGEIDLSNVKELIDALDVAAKKAPEGFIIDLTDVTYLDSAGVQAIFTAYRAVRESDGRLALVIGNPMIRSVLEVVHLEQLPGMSVCDDLDSARQDLSRV